MKSAKYEVIETAAGFHANLKGPNGKIVATSNVKKKESEIDEIIAKSKVLGSNEANFRKKNAKNGEAFFTLNEPNDAHLFKGETYIENRNRDNGIKTFMKYSQSPVVKKYLKK